MLETKSSGVDWLDKIPASWKIERMKNQFEYTKGLNITKADLIDVGVAVVSYGQIHAKNNPGTTLKDEFIRYISPSNEAITDKAKLCNGDIVFADTSEDYDGLGNAVYMDRDTETYAGYHTIIARPKEPRYAKFFAYLFQSESWRSQLRMRASGIKVYSVTQRMLNDITLIMPKDTEVEPICSYLDDRCSKIDTIIAEAKASIEEYQKLKQVVIYETVTKGLDKRIPMKYSGNIHIKDIPINWNLVNLKYLLTDIVDCPHETPNYEVNGSFYVIRTADEDLGFLRSDDNMYRLNKEEYKNRIRRLSLNKDDIVYGREGERWGLACLVPENNKYCLGQRMMQFRCDTNVVEPRFLMWALNSKGTRMQGVVDTIGSTSPHVNISTIRNFQIPCPGIEEQRKIAKYIDDTNSNIDSIISEKQSLIEDLEAYKKSLIYEVVTGKRKVVA